MRRKITLAILSLVVSVQVFAQQDPQFTMNMFNRLATNAGYAGTNGAICGTLLARKQWMSFDKGSNWNGGKVPQTALLSIDAPVAVLHGGVGLTVYNDQLGFQKTTAAKAAYSFHQTIGEGKLGIGAELGMQQLSIGGDWKATDDWRSDASIPASAAKTVFDAGLGLYYSTDKLYVGLSAQHLNGAKATKSLPKDPTTGVAKSLDYNVARHYYITAGYTYEVSPTVDIIPTIYAKTDGATMQADFNVNVRYNKMLWGGLSYRLKDAMAIIGGFQAKEFKVGVSYDVTTSAIRTSGGSKGSVEFMLGYCYRIVKNTSTQKSKNVRFL